MDWRCNAARAAISSPYFLGDAPDGDLYRHECIMPSDAVFRKQREWVLVQIGLSER